MDEAEVEVEGEGRWRVRVRVRVRVKVRVRVRVRSGSARNPEVPPPARNNFASMTEWSVDHQHPTH
jgi:hypothetical protein